MDITIQKQIIELIKREVVPAIGCTEPMAVALAVAKASETLCINSSISGTENVPVLLFISDNK